MTFNSRTWNRPRSSGESITESNDEIMEINIIEESNEETGIPVTLKAGISPTLIPLK